MNTLEEKCRTREQRHTEYQALTKRLDMITKNGGKRVPQKLAEQAAELLTETVSSVTEENGCN